MKFATDGAVLTNTKSAVQGSMKLIPADEHRKVLLTNDLPEYLDKEVTLYYYIGIKEGDLYMLTISIVNYKI